MEDSYPLPEEQKNAVNQLPAEGRYKHFISRVADREKVWSLRAPDGWVLMSESESTSAVPVWPHPEYALVHAVGPWESAIPTAIEVHEFVDVWLPGLSKESALVAVFPDSQGRAPLVDAMQLHSDLVAALEQIE